MAKDQTITYFPDSEIFVKGHHETLPLNAADHAIAETTRIHSPESIKNEAAPKIETRPIDVQARSLMAAIKNNKTQIKTGQLTAADFEAQRDNLDHLILIRLYNQLMGEQTRWFHLDAMFNQINMDKLLMRMSFKDNPADAQTVPRRGQYDPTKVNYQEINFDLPKVVVSYDMPIEDPLRALISPIQPLQAANDYSMAFHREREALAALKQIGNYYRKGQLANGADAFNSTTEPTGNDLISDPNALATTGVHSTHKTVNEIQDARNAFMQTHDVILTHFAMSPRTAMHLAQNTWTESNTIFNVEAYRTNGGVRQFPGLSEATAVISQIVEDKFIYAVAKPQNVMVKAEGPKITRTWEDQSRWTTQTATADFHQYKCAHEDLTFARKFAVIFKLA